MTKQPPPPNVSLSISLIAMPGKFLLAKTMKHAAAVPVRRPAALVENIGITTTMPNCFVWSVVWYPVTPLSLGVEAEAAAVAVMGHVWRHVVMSVVVVPLLVHLEKKKK